MGNLMQKRENKEYSGSRLFDNLAFVYLYSITFIIIMIQDLSESALNCYVCEYYTDLHDIYNDVCSCKWTWITFVIDIFCLKIQTAAHFYFSFYERSKTLRLVQFFILMRTKRVICASAFKLKSETICLSKWNKTIYHFLYLDLKLHSHWKWIIIWITKMIYRSSIQFLVNHSSLMEISYCIKCLKWHAKLWIATLKLSNR